MTKTRILNFGGWVINKEFWPEYVVYIVKTQYHENVHKLSANLSLHWFKKITKEFYFEF